jgi:Kef-type K+ transport system membrane component KefB
MTRPPRSLLSPTLAALLAASIAHSVQAQTYRIVAPDGKVTFSDRRPTDPSLQTSEVGHAPPPASLFAPGAVPLDAPAGASAPATASGKHAKHALANSGTAPAGNPPTPAAATGVPFPPGLPEAVLIVIGKEDIVQTVWDVCTRTLPTSFARYDDAVRTWRRRNETMILKADHILFSAFTVDQRALVHSTAQERLRATMAQIWAGTPAQKIKWCDKSADDLAAGGLDLIGDQKVSGPSRASRCADRAAAPAACFPCQTPGVCSTRRAWQRTPACHSLPSFGTPDARHSPMSTTEIFLVAMIIILAVPYLVWRLLNTDYWAPLVVVQIIAGIVLGPGVLGRLYPDYFHFVFNPPVVGALNGIAWWAVMVFVCIAGIELDLRRTWQHRRESVITAGFALGTPLLFGSAAALAMLYDAGWIGPKAQSWQFVLGVGMACAVTALPILILLMDKLEVLRQPIGQRILRYASLDDIAIWAVLALILMDWQRIGRQVAFLASFALLTWMFRKLMRRAPDRDRWFLAVIWLALCAFGADWSGLHYMVGAFLAGAVMDAEWFDQDQMDMMRKHVLLLVMPVYFLSTGLRTQWNVGGAAVFVAAAVLLVMSVAGKLIGIRIAGRLLKWQAGEASIIGWLLQTKALIMIIFVNVLLDKQIISSDTFTALLLMAVGSTMLTVPVVAPKLARMKAVIFRSS